LRRTITLWLTANTFAPPRRFGEDRRFKEAIQRAMTTPPMHRFTKQKSKAMLAGDVVKTADDGTLQ
jgi:hypothetical protein